MYYMFCNPEGKCMNLEFICTSRNEKMFHSLYFSETIISGGNLIDYVGIISFVKHWYS